jgi:regulation of enolase protein 1 (concanavalin A-like superfamily)
MLSRPRVTRVGYLSVLIISLVGFSSFNRPTAVAQQAWSLPSPWSAQDIGNPAIPSTGSFNQGTFTITAEGSDIWGQSDQFNFIYQQVSGDVDVIARVDSLLATNSWAKSGVMIRSSLAPGAAHGSTLVTPANGVDFQRRPTDGALSQNTYGPAAAAPYWVRLVRKGSTVTAYCSPNGSTWSAIGSQTIALGASAYVGIATTSHNTSSATTATVSQVTVNSLSLPAPQRAMDIGAPAIAGSTTYNQGVYTIHAGGSDIWGTSDQFQFVYQPMTGDGEVVARVRSITNTNDWAKAGVMIRETLAAGSRHASAFVTPRAGYAFQRRIDPGGISQSTAVTGTAPGWLRLVRVGTQIDAYRSADGNTWTLIGSDAVPMADAVYVGMAVTSHNTAVATDALIDNFRVTLAGSTTNQPPTVAITSPTGGSTFTAGSNIAVTAAANDSDGTVSRVDFFVGTTQIGSDTTAPYSATWSNVAAGTYNLTAKAVDNDGASTTSAVSVQVTTTTNQPPTVSLTAPANGASYTAPATVSLTATASDPNGTISKVEFYNGTTLLNSDTTSPYSYSWSNVAAGTYGLRAVAYDNAGASASSATVSITVSTTTSTSFTGLIAAYALNEGAGSTVSSSVSGGPTGVITNATWATGRYGKALSFAGNGQVNFGDFDLTGSFTIMAWLQTRSLYTSSCGSFVMKVHDYGFEICGGQLYGEVGANGVWTGRVIKTLTSADLNVWKHVALTYDGTTVRMYVDGVLVSSSAGAHTTTANPLLVGQWMPAGEYLDGMADEVRLYSRTLTQSEIQTNMNTAIGGTTGNQSPTVTLSSPITGATFTAPASVTLSASASDSDGTISKVEFYNGTTLLNTDTTSAYSFTWSNVAAGTYSVKAIAYDNSGASTSSATSTITVSTLTSTIPTGVIFTASPDHATLVTNYELRIYAAGANPSTATPIAKSNLGKPTPDANNDITVTNLSTFFSTLTVGNYVGAVAAVGSGGSSVSTGVTFTR